MADKEAFPYFNYFGYLLAGVVIAEKMTPNLKDASNFEEYLLLCISLYGGALMGSYFYKLTHQEEKEEDEDWECKCECACCMEAQK